MTHCLSRSVSQGNETPNQFTAPVSVPEHISLSVSRSVCTVTFIFHSLREQFFFALVFCAFLVIPFSSIHFVHLCEQGQTENKSLAAIRKTTKIKPQTNFLHVCSLIFPRGVCLCVNECAFLTARKSQKRNCVCDHRIEITHLCCPSWEKTERAMMNILQSLMFLQRKILQLCN